MSALMEAAVAGDREAILAVMAAAHGDIRRYARRACRNSSDAEDAVQETLWILYRRIGGLRRLGAFSGWLFQVVRRACLKLARQGWPVATAEMVAEDAKLSERPDAELRLDLAAAIQSLPGHYRDVLLLRDIEELTIDEIGVRLDLTRESVKARLHRARVLVREYLS
ncbi:MAG: sigma-70 family RNA polymerase sigma factor [Asticcacaulis sp.]|nr:sigma-70 family RNA polymerase sigma factor [Asticcacaulis sp.]